MLIPTKKSWPVTVALVLLSAAAARAQHYQPFDDVTRTYDMQVFAPNVVPELDGTVPPNEGVYFTYDRVYTSMSQPGHETLAPGSDFTWGHRYDFGYMTEEQHGWAMTVWDVSSPRVSSVRTMVDRNGDPQLDLRGGVVGQLKDSVNDGKLFGIELNKVFRMNTTDKGRTFEPFLGVRYVKFDDRTMRQTFTVFDEGLATENDSLATSQAFRRNEMIGGQLGLRAQSRRGRLVLSSELRAFAFQNFQDQNRINTEENLRPSPIAPDPRHEFIRTESSYTKREFVFGGELRVEAAFEFSREIAARVGLDVTEFARGVGRGFDYENSESLTLAGLTFGVTVNR